MPNHATIHPVAQSTVGCEAASPQNPILAPGATCLNTVPVAAAAASLSLSLRVTQRARVGGETKATVGPTSASASKGLQCEVPDAAVKIHAA